MKRLLPLLCALLLLLPAAASAEAAVPLTTSGWAREEVAKAVELGLMYRPARTPDTRMPITRGDFAENAAALAALECGSNLKSYVLITRYRRQAEQEEHVSYTAFDVAKELGILQGRGDGDDAAAPVTRQEAAVMLARTYRAYQSAVPSAAEGVTFLDGDEIAPWALADVGLMSRLGVMTGVGEGRFDPLGSYTVEQCMASLLRLHEKAPRSGFEQENPFALSKSEGGLFQTWDAGYDLAFAIETDDYYICALDPSADGVGLSPSCYEINLVAPDFSLRTYSVPILTRISERGSASARPEHPVLSEDGTALSYTATLEEDTYDVWSHTDADKVLMFERGIYTVTLALATGEQTWTRAEPS